jgi:hypothetical protein
MPTPGRSASSAPCIWMSHGSGATRSVEDIPSPRRAGGRGGSLFGAGGRGGSWFVVPPLGGLRAFRIVKACFVAVSERPLGTHPQTSLRVPPTLWASCPGGGTRKRSLRVSFRNRNSVEQRGEHPRRWQGKGGKPLSFRPRRSLAAQPDPVIPTQAKRSNATHPVISTEAERSNATHPVISTEAERSNATPRHFDRGGAQQRHPPSFRPRRRGATPSGETSPRRP